MGGYIDCDGEQIQTINFMNMNKKTYLWIILPIKIGLTILFLSIFFRRIDINSLQAVIRSVKPAYFGAALLVVFFNMYWVSTVRWKHLINFDVTGGMRKLCMLSFISQGLNFIFPGNIVGDIVKGFGVSDENTSGRLIVSSIIMDRIVIMTSLTILSVAGLFLTRKSLWEARLFLCPVVIVGILVAGMSAVYNRRLRGILLRIFLLPNVPKRKVVRFLKVFDIYRQNKRCVGKAILTALCATLLTTVSYYLIGRGLSMGLNYWIWFSFVPIVIVTCKIPVTIGGLGVREGMLMFLLSSVGVAPEMAVSVSLLFFVITSITSIMGVALYLILQLKKFSEMNFAREAT